MAERIVAPYSVTRFPNGVGSAPVGEVLENWGLLDVTKYHTLFDDFNFLGGWTSTTTAIVAGAGGLATITAAGSIATSASWRPDLGRRQFLKVRAAAAGATSVGLVGWVDAVAAPTTGLYVTFVNGLFTLTVGTATVTYQRTFTAAEFVTFGLVHEPGPSSVPGNLSRVILYVDNRAVASISDATLPTGANLILAAKATTADVTLDYLLASMER